MFGHMSAAGTDGKFRLDPGGNYYMGPERTALHREGFLHELECDVYGFSFIYDAYQSSVLPITHEGDLGTQAGSSFVVADDMLVTAAHCLEGARRISIRSVAVADLERSQIWKFSHELLDLAIVKFASAVLQGLRPIKMGEPRLLQPVVALGYPDVPGFHQTLAAERATISSRYTAVTGAVTAIAKDIWTPTDLLLVTARVRGGISGGPLISERGRLVGLVTREPAQDASVDKLAHKYDNLGYGVAIPSAAVARLVASASGAATEEIVELKGMSFAEYV
jgi:S1-C subfamily serine protease